VHDLADPITWLPDGCVDLVLCALAIEYVDDRVAALREFRRVLRPGGALVLSRLHPSACSNRGRPPEAAALDRADYELHTREPRGFMAFRLVPRPEQ
jgi:ubiquinone/menaquinone biosynthesis C-methylase UbiE